MNLEYCTQYRYSLPDTEYQTQSTRHRVPNSLLAGYVSRSRVERAPPRTISAFPAPQYHDNEVASHHNRDDQTPIIPQSSPPPAYSTVSWVPINIHTFISPYYPILYHSSAYTYSVYKDKDTAPPDARRCFRCTASWASLNAHFIFDVLSRAHLLASTYTPRLQAHRMTVYLGLR